MKTAAEIKLWGTVIGAVSVDSDDKTADFEYNPSFIQSGIQLSPVMMPLKSGVYRFPGLPYGTYHGLPGLVSDSLPDKFGNDIITLWLARQGRFFPSFHLLRSCLPPFPLKQQADISVHTNAKRSDKNQVNRIIQIEKPFHPFCLSFFAVVQL